MKSNDMKTIKELGRQIYPFDQNVWDKYIVEANPNDTVWASGLKEDDKDITNISKHKGQNLLGKILMKVRDIYM